MLYFSFYDKAFPKEYRVFQIEMVIAPKSTYEDELSFVNAALDFLGDRVYKDIDMQAEHEGVHLKDGEYRDIVQHWIQTIEQSITINFDEIQKIQRIKCNHSDPLQDEFLIQTEDEYIMFLWSTAE